MYSFRLPSLSLLAICILSSTHAAASSSLWQDIASRSTQSVESQATKAFKHRRLSLDETNLKVHLSQQLSSVVNIELPLPDGSFVAVTLTEESLLAPAVQQRFPDIKTWKISSDDPRIISGRAELTELGLHAMLRTQDGDRLYIEPEQQTPESAARNYHSFSKRANRSNTQRTFSCGAKAKPEFSWQPARPELTRSTRNFAKRPGELLYTYDLAMAATGEYTQQFNGSESAAYSAVVTTVNRVNEIFEQELSIKLRLVSGTEIVYSNPNTDPYENGSAIKMATQNQSVLDSVVGSANYDIGHVLGWTYGGDGIALVESLCDNGYKAQGSTSSNNLLGDSFIVDYVAHELGHQLGATHTFNGTRISCGGGGRINETAYEPGSGSTIMSYAGLCGSDDIQNNVDAQFHAASIEQIRELTHYGKANACASVSSLSNRLPIVNAGSDYTIPAGTPFLLTGSASDADGDKLLYGWDQKDAGSASTIGTDTSNNALIKSSVLSSSPQRHVPDIQRLLNTVQSFSTGESLPSTNRILNFRLTARDGNGAAVSDDMRVTVRDTGAVFSVLSPTNSLNPGTHTISWNVANTDQAPISCSHVDIAYTNNQGTTFTNLILNTANDGSETVSLNDRTQNIRIKCSNNIFFALSGTYPHIASNRSSGGGDSNVVTIDDLGGGSSSGGGGPLHPGLLFGFGVLVVLRLVSKTPHPNPSPQGRGANTTLSPQPLSLIERGAKAPVKILALGSILFFTLLSGCAEQKPKYQPHTPPTSTNSRDAQFIEKLAKLRDKDPVQAAQENIAKGERYFLCNAGRSRTVPGLGVDEYAVVKGNCPTRCLEGVTDALYGPNHTQYVSEAVKFSGEWNRVMLGVCSS